MSTFQRPHRPSTEGRQREGGLFSLVDALGRRPGSKQGPPQGFAAPPTTLARANSSSASAFPPPRSGIKLSTSSSEPLFPTTSSITIEPLTTSAYGAAATRDKGPALPPRPAKPPTPNVMPPLPSALDRSGGGGRRGSTPSGGTRAGNQSPAPPVSAPGPSRPSTQSAASRGNQYSSATGTPTMNSLSGTYSGSAGRRPGSTGFGAPDRGQAEFHRGLVGALHEVLRKQRNGVFPQVSLEAEVQQEVADARAKLASRESVVEQMVRSRKAEWAQNQWRDIKRRERHAAERQASAGLRGPRSGFSTVTPDAMGLEDGDGGMWVDPDLVAAIIDTEKRELRARSAMFGAEERARREIVDAFEKFDTSFEKRDADALKAQGNRLYESGDFLGAHRFYTMAIDADPTNPVLLTNRAAASMMLMNYDSCIKDCLAAAEADPTLPRAFSRMAHGYLLLGQYRQAARHYATSLSLATSQQWSQSAVDQLAAEAAAVTVVERARKLLDASAHEEAARALAGLPVFKNDPPIVFMRMQALAACDPQTARTELSRYIGTLDHPACEGADIVARAAATAFYCDVLVLLARASYCCGQHYFNIASSYVRQCLAIRSECRPALLLQKTLSVLEARLNEISDFIAAEKFSEAYAALTAALAIDPSNKKVRATLFYNRAEVTLKMPGGTAASAIIDFTNTLECDPIHVRALSERAKAFAAIGDFRQALADMDRAVTLNPALREDFEQLRRQYAEECREADEAEQHRRRPRATSGAYQRDSGHQQQHQHQQQAGGGGTPRRPSTGHGAATKCHYEALQVPRFSSTDVIKQQYRRLTLRYHPDKVVSQPPDVRDACMQRFKEISHAYSVLSDAASKAQYDLSIHGLRAAA